MSDFSGPNDPAFPTFAEINGKEVVGGDGLTKREYIATHALQGLLTNGAHALTLTESPSGLVIQPDLFAKVAADMADALLARLKERS